MKRALIEILGLVAVVLMAEGAAVSAAFAQAPEVPPAVAEPASGPRFDLTEIRVEGNSVLPTIEIERAVYSHLGEGRGIEDVEKARAALEKAYHDAGYLTVLVDIPEQKVSGGVVRLKVTEGSVERTRITGSRYYSQGAIRAAVPTLAAGTVPHFPQVQDELAQLSRTPDRRVTPVLRPGRTPGKVEVELKVEDSLPLHASVELNNRASPNTSDLRLSALARYDNLWQREHSFSLQAQTSPQDTHEVRVFSGTYTLPVGSANQLLALYAVRSRSNIAALGETTVVGDGNIYGLRAIIPLPARSGYYHSLTLGADYKDFQETVNTLGEGFNTPIDYVPVVAQYSATHSGEATSQFNVGATLGVRGLFGNHDAEFENKRFNARASFLAVRGDLQRTQPLPANWVLHGRLDFQLAKAPLVSSEQFGAGGVDSVRGYLEGERFGDRGWRGQLELRTPNLFAADGIETRLHVFAEGAELNVYDPLPGSASRYYLGSAGVGLRSKGPRGLRIDADYGRALKDAAVTQAGDHRLHFRLAYEF